jgi:hypothetical protein
MKVAFCIVLHFDKDFVLLTLGKQHKNYWNLQNKAETTK